ncbi:MAG: PilZ domain-containing protein [Acidobacteriota bacterium]|nr:PilZ domain-containing protein [Acidobacteriota bacterium]
MDRRTKSRMDVQLTCYVSGGKVQAAPIRAFTENVSRTGMLMRWMPGVPLPSLDKKLILDLELPENSEFGPRVMRCRTEVVRISPCEGDTYEVALRVEAMRFIKTKKAPRTRDLAAMPLPVDRVI